MYSKILVAVDFSPDAAGILRKARQFAAIHGAALVLAHISEPAALSAAMIGPDGLGVVSEDVELDQRLVEAARDRLDALAAEAGIEGAELRVELGLPSLVLVQLVEQAGADLILIGHHQRHGLGLLLSSGTDRSVLHRAPCDVLAVSP